MRKLIIVGLITFVPIWVSAQKAFKNWPEGVSPKEIGELVSKRFVEVPHPNFNGNPAPPNEITYPETCAWFGALRYADKPIIRDCSGNWKSVSYLFSVRNVICNHYLTM